MSFSSKKSNGSFIRTYVVELSSVYRLSFCSDLALARVSILPMVADEVVVKVILEGTWWPTAQHSVSLHADLIVVTLYVDSLAFHRRFQNTTLSTFSLVLLYAQLWRVLLYLLLRIL